MAQVIQTICDVCQANEEPETLATPVTLNGSELDICEEHTKLPLRELLDGIAAGRYAARPASAASDEDLRCPFGCNNGKPYVSLQGKRSHVTRAHKDAA